MSRICTDSEKKLIQDNSALLLSGIYNTTAQLKSFDIFIVLITYFVLLAATGIPLIIFTDGKALAYAGGMVTFPYLIALFAISWFGVRVITQRTRTAHNRRRFMRADRIKVSGATLLATLTNNKGSFLMYIEDDATGSDGRPYIMECPATSGDLKLVSPQDRLIILYAADADSVTSYQLMRYSDSVRGLIPEYPPLNTASINLYDLPHYPHPNAMSIDYKERIITPSNKSFYADHVLKIWRGQNGRIIKICSAILFISINLIISLLSFAEHADNGTVNIFKTVCMFVAANAGVAYFMSFIAHTKARGEKNMTDFVSVTEVLFKSYVPARLRLNAPPASGGYDGYSSTALTAAYISVYEWDGEQFVINDYPIGVNYKGNLGDVMYKFMLKNGSFMLYPKKRIS